MSEANDLTFGQETIRNHMSLSAADFLKHPNCEWDRRTASVIDREIDALRERADLADRYIKAATENYPENWAMDPGNPELTVSNIKHYWKDRAEQAEADRKVLRVLCDAGAALIDDLNRGEFAVPAVMETYRMVRTSASAALGRAGV